MSNTNEWLPIKLEAGAMDVFVARPSEPAGLGIVMLQEIFGVNDAMRRKAQLFAEAGFVVAVPDLFWRLERRVDLQYGEEDRKKGFGLMQRFDFKAGIQDVLSTADWLKTQSGVNEKVALVGFCIGGKLAVVAGAKKRFAAIASFYGVKLDENFAELDAVEVPLQINVGDRDAHVPMETVGKLKSHLTKQPNASVYVYPDALHGFFNEKREDVYNSEAALLARQRTFEMLRSVAA